MTTTAETSMMLKQVVAREANSRMSRLERDVNGPLPPIYADRAMLFRHRATEDRIHGALHELAAKRGFELRWSEALEEELTRKGYSLHERLKIRHRIEAGYLRLIGRPDELGVYAPPKIDLVRLLAEKGLKPSEPHEILALRWIAAIYARSDQEFSRLNQRATTDPEGALAEARRLVALHAIEDRLHWPPRPYDGVDALEQGDFDISVLGAMPEILDTTTLDPEARQGTPTTAPMPATAEAMSLERPVSYPVRPATVVDHGCAAISVVVDSGVRQLPYRAAEDPSRSLMALIERLIETNSSWAKETKRQHRAGARLLALTAGTEDMKLIKQHHIGAYVTNLSKLPKSHGKSSKDDYRTLQELLDLAAQVPENERAEKVGLSVGTVNRHLTQLGTILKFAKLYGFDIGDPASLASARRVDKRKQKDKRTLFSRAELATLFRYAVWSMSRGSNQIAGLRKSWPSDLACVYWLPLLGMYSFARLSELCYLRVIDVDIAEQLLIICETDERGLKTEGSERKVPLHPELIRLGFLRYVADIQRQGSDLLFPDLRARGAKTPLGDLFATLWNFVLDTALPTARASKKTFHSLRHTGNTIMINQGVLDAIREALLGHEGKTTNTRIYGHELELETLRRTINAFPSMTDHLQPIF